MADFHFLRPEWLWALVPLALVIWLAHRSKSQSQWQTWVANHLTPALLGQQQSQPVIFKTWFLSLLWLITAVALAGPTWEKIEKPLFKSNRASVIVMDMSMSMRSTDVSPDRLTKSRFKAIDLASELGEGEVGLVAYAGDAFTISPLTQDPRNIASLIPSLSPEIMPVPGSYPLLGLLQAEQLMKQAGYLEGQIYWITDGVDLEDLDELREFASQTPFNISVLAVGTPMGAPIKLVDGSLLKDKGNIVIPKLNVDALADISAISGGETITWTADNKDILSLAALGSTKLSQKNEGSFDSNHPNTANQDGNDQQNGSALTGDDWHEAGPWLVLLIMPLLLYVFRKGVSRNLLSLVLMGLTSVSVTTGVFVSPQALAFNNGNVQNKAPLSATQTEEQASPQAVSSPNEGENNTNTVIDRIFKTGDQRGYEAYSNGNYNAAQQQFDHDQWKASAAYKNKDYEQALSLFSNDTSALGYYNQGNALAHLGELDKAIDAYNKALELDSSLDKAIENRKILEQLKQQQEQQNAENQSNSDESKNDNQNDQNQSGSNQGEQNSEQSSGQQSDQQENQEQNGQNQNANNEPSSSAQQNQESSQNQQNTPNNSNNSSNSEQDEQTSQQNSQQAGQSQPSEDQLDEQQTNSEQAGSANMTPEQVAEKEKQQRIEQLLRKVDDNPSVLLRNKMILENKRRQYERRYPKGVEKTW